MRNLQARGKIVARPRGNKPHGAYSGIGKAADDFIERAVAARDDELPLARFRKRTRKRLGISRLSGGENAVLHAVLAKTFFHRRDDFFDAARMGVYDHVVHDVSLP